MKHVKYILPVDMYIKQLPSYDTFGRKSTFRLNPDEIPGLQWNLANSYHTTTIGLTIPSANVYIYPLHRCQHIELYQGK